MATPQKKTPSPNNGFILAGLIVGLTVLLPYFILPQYEQKAQMRYRSAQHVIQQSKSLTRAAQQAEAAFNKVYGAAANNLAGVSLPTASQLYDQFTSAAGNVQRVSPLNLTVSRKLVSSRGGHDSYLQFLYPNLTLSRFDFQIQGPLGDVISFLKTQVETQPFYLYRSISINVGSAGAWPTYRISVYLPVSGN